MQEYIYVKKMLHPELLAITSGVWELGLWQDGGLSESGNRCVCISDICRQCLVRGHTSKSAVASVPGSLQGALCTLDYFSELLDIILCELELILIFTNFLLISHVKIIKFTCLRKVNYCN